MATSENGRGCTRRKALLSMGAVAGVAALGKGCAFFTGGAVHPEYQGAGGELQGKSLRLDWTKLPWPADGSPVLVKPGEGYVDLLARKTADGVTVITADCTHFGCTVGWDAAARQWECPCHGSRFAADGKVVEGPADEPLRVPPHSVEDSALTIELAGFEDD